MGPFVLVSGCTDSTPEGLVGQGDAYAQTVQAIADPDMLVQIEADAILAN